MRTRGWAIFDTDTHGIEIQKDDEAGLFDSDEAALDHICNNPDEARACIEELLAMLNGQREDG